MDTQVVDFLKIILTGLFGAVIAPFMTMMVIPFYKEHPPFYKEHPNERPNEGSKERGEEEVDKIKEPLIKQESTSKKRGEILRWAAIGLVIFGILGYFLIMPTFISSCPHFASTSVPITSPTSNSSVSQSPIVQGAACNIPSDKKLWLLVVAGGVPGYYPQNGPILPSSDGKWSASANLGGKDSFVLYTALADQESEAAIQNYFKSAPNFKPLDPLPAGIELMSQVLVVT